MKYHNIIKWDFITLKPFWGKKLTFEFCLTCYRAFSVIDDGRAYYVGVIAKFAKQIKAISSFFPVLHCLVRCYGVYPESNRSSEGVWIPPD